MIGLKIASPGSSVTRTAARLRGARRVSTTGSPGHRGFGLVPAMLAALALVFSFAVVRSASADQYVSPSKSVAASSATNLNLGGAGQTTSVDLTTSRRSRILVVHASAQQNSGTNPQTVSLIVTANGVRLEPNSVSQSCPNNICAVSATFFLDMAQAEAAHPGVFYNNKLPMTVESQGISNAAGNSGRLVLVAELLRK
ncbi:MAG TPA: hypothetical protein VFD92_25900 [Candidatus Binatia bacterium]|nr:hypothetical protein [Candidatus Binatia bacterium]